MLGTSYDHPQHPYPDYTSKLPQAENYIVTSEQQLQSKLPSDCNACRTYNRDHVKSRYAPAGKRQWEFVEQSQLDPDHRMSYMWMQWCQL